MKRLYSEYKDVIFTIEMHKSTWCNDLENYEIKDLFLDGVLYNNPEKLNASKKVKEKIQRGYYNIHPVPPLFFKNSALSGYVYIMDTPHGMRKFYEK